MMGLDPARQAVLVNMAFNLGASGLLGFGQFLNYVKLGQNDQAAADMLNTEWARQVGARASRLSEQLRTGAWV
jgi:lysozyme